MGAAMATPLKTKLVLTTVRGVGRLCREGAVRSTLLAREEPPARSVAHHLRFTFARIRLTAAQGHGEVHNLLPDCPQGLRITVFRHLAGCGFQAHDDPLGVVVRWLPPTPPSDAG